MTKKSRRVRKKGRQVRLSPTQLVRPVALEGDEVSPEAAMAGSMPSAADLREDYRYVVADLKRIGIVAAAAALALVIVLVLVLPQA